MADYAFILNPSPGNHFCNFGSCISWYGFSSFQYISCVYSSIDFKCSFIHSYNTSDKLRTRFKHYNTDLNSY